ncbi:hypothetical protein FCM35_KLT17569 [Carex littledalei]|uniref:CCHC-type domain-containing protein n=1 Tax=Carex littledalei TaxID=544730 RepID=A0A833RCB6_9POAL|nr:hypothetical protein FCM35_KLT17569 [Carex littledalei]
MCFHSILELSCNDWQVVRRRRRYPDNWRTPSDVELDKVRPYVPYSTKPTFAEVVARSNSTTIGSGNSSYTSSSAKTSPASSQPSSPKTPPGAQFYYSPHSPTLLRFPPHSSFPEWRGRCYRCCRTGHTQAKCRNPYKCGKCWKNGHVASRCRVPMLNPAARPFHPNVHAYKPAKAEPPFDELLKGEAQPPKPHMPDGRPKEITVFVERDDAFFTEVDRLSNAVVMYCRHQALALEAHRVVRMAVDTKLLRPEEVRVAQLAGERFLIHLPRGLAVETSVRALPADLWDQGFTFQQWSILDEANVNMPRFKVLLDIVGLPPHLRRETTIINGIAQFGVYLGSVLPEHASDHTTWRVAVGTDDLNCIPESLKMVVGGLEYITQIVPVHWAQGPIYDASGHKGPYMMPLTSRFFPSVSLGHRSRNPRMTMTPSLLRRLRRKEMTP